LPRYKIVETTKVTDEELERIVNEWVGQGWELDGFQFITHEASKRPKMAFVLFTTPSEDEYDEDEEDEDEVEEEGQTN
jgi:hypothetical protein